MLTCVTDAARVPAQPPAPVNHLLRLPKCGAQELLLFLEWVPRPEPLQPTADFMELSGGSPANNVGCCAESGGAQLPPPAGAALLLWLWLPLYLTAKHESLPAKFPNFLLSSIMKKGQINCLDVLNQSFRRFSRNDAGNVNEKKQEKFNSLVPGAGKYWKLPSRYVETPV